MYPIWSIFSACSLNYLWYINAILLYLLLSSFIKKVFTTCEVRLFSYSIFNARSPYYLSSINVTHCAAVLVQWIRSGTVRSGPVKCAWLMNYFVLRCIKTTPFFLPPPLVHILMTYLCWHNPLPPFLPPTIPDANTSTFAPASGYVTVSITNATAPK